MTRLASPLFVALLAACSPGAETQPEAPARAVKTVQSPPPPRTSASCAASAIVRLVLGYGGTLGEVIERFGEPKEIRPVADRSSSVTGPTHEYIWGRDTSVVPGYLTAFVGGGSVHSIILVPDDKEPESVMNALGIGFGEVHYAFCSTEKGNQETYKARLMESPDVRWEFVDSSEIVTLILDDRGKVAMIRWGRSRHHYSRAECSK